MRFFRAFVKNQKSPLPRKRERAEVDNASVISIVALVVSTGFGTVKITAGSLFSPGPIGLTVFAWGLFGFAVIVVIAGLLMFVPLAERRKEGKSNGKWQEVIYDFDSLERLTKDAES